LVGSAEAMCEESIELVAAQAVERGAHRDALRRWPKRDPIPAVCEIHSAVAGTAGGEELRGRMVIQ
jgi:hypothetical protein